MPLLVHALGGGLIHGLCLSCKNLNVLIVDLGDPGDLSGSEQKKKNGNKDISDFLPLNKKFKKKNQCGELSYFVPSANGHGGSDGRVVVDKGKTVGLPLVVPVQSGDADGVDRHVAQIRDIGRIFFFCFNNGKWSFIFF